MMLLQLAFAFNFVTTAKPSDEAMALLAEMRKAYEKVPAITFEVEVIHPIAQGDEKGVPIAVSFQKPSSLRIDLKTPVRQFRAVSNGAELVVSDFKRTPYRTKLTDSNRLGFFPLHLETLALIDPKSFNTEVGGRMEKSVVSLSIEKGVPTLKEEREDGETDLITVDPKTHLIDHIIVWKKDGKEPFASYRVKKVNLKPTFEPGFFDFPTH